MDNSGWKSVDILAYTLLIIGAMSWGWMGFFGVDPIALVFGSMTRTSKFIYSLICLAAFYDLLSLPAIFRRWDLHLRTYPADSQVS